MSAPTCIARVLCPYLHCHKAVVYEDLLGEEIGAYRGFVARAELLIDLTMCQTELSMARGDAIEGRGCARTYWFIKLVLPTPLSPRMMTCASLVGAANANTSADPSYLQKNLLSRCHGA